MYYMDQKYGALVSAAVRNATREGRRGMSSTMNMKLWDELANGADVSVLVGNLDDEDDVCCLPVRPVAEVLVSVPIQSEAVSRLPGPACPK